ncbi:hypothetical protein QF031_000830 [Pseudarthrobacter defluvii]|uniref:hypothetical protein n=1 Tax=Pseudarthrobacter defluvii TaxID=410837 RepID=UPI00278228DA|nr:hypothetical protein [Pseudarthrobacter defluvii]MDQ0768081.1 hypothetical protein [Pseudarthrobacter defluvii]
MTVVLEPQTHGESPYAGNRGEHQQESRTQIAWNHPAAALPDAAFSLDDPAAPFHCGTAMTASPVPLPSLSWAPTELDCREWTCACGFKLDVGITADSMEAVRLESAMLESLQWEMDAVRERFESAVRTASRLGAAPEALGKAAGLTGEELQEILTGGVRLL